MQTFNKLSKSTIALGLLSCTLWYGCKDEVDLPYQPLDSYTQVYMPQNVNGPVSKVLKIKDSVQTVIYGAVYGGVGYPESDVAVSFKIDPLKVDSFNLVNNTNYPLLPAESYTLSGISGVISKGTLSTQPFNVSFKTMGAGAMTALKTYILPISLISPSVKVNSKLATVFYIITAQPDLNDYPIYSRTNWTVDDFSSQEANGEGANNGRAIFALDGDKNTFWHTQWQGGEPGPPHSLTIDMNESKVIHGLSFQARQEDGGPKPKAVNVQVSEDKITWQNGGSFQLQNNQNVQFVFLPEGFKTGRYFKVTINSLYAGRSTQVAELNAF